MALLVLSIDRLYAVIAPFKYHARNHQHFAIKAFCYVGIFTAMCLVVGVVYVPINDDIDELCLSTNIYRGMVIVIIGISLLLTDLLTITLNITMVVILRCCKKSVFKSGTAAAKAEQERQVHISLKAVSQCILGENNMDSCQCRCGTCSMWHNTNMCVYCV